MQQQLHECHEGGLGSRHNPYTQHDGHKPAAYEDLTGSDDDTVFKATKSIKCCEVDGVNPISELVSSKAGFRPIEDPEDEHFTDDGNLNAPARVLEEALTSRIKSSTKKSSRKYPHDKVAKRNRNELSITDRKRIFVWKRTAKLNKAMKDWVSFTYDLLDPFREDDDCWLHPHAQRSVLLASGSERGMGHISRNFTWTDNRGSHSLTVNFGIVAKLVARKITQRQKDGFITQTWHLSHLCGNWTCLNPKHTTVEKGSINIARNYCFSHRAGCLHHPQCMKDKKLPLGPDGQVQSQHPTSFNSGSLSLPSKQFQFPPGYETDELMGKVDDHPFFPED